MGNEQNRIAKVIDGLLSDGRICVTRQEMSCLLNVSNNALKAAMNRMVRKGIMARIYKGFYVLVPPFYRHQRILPPVLFIDYLMRFIERPYYVSLLSAAELYGAAHQRPQEFQVMISKPSIRAITIGNLRIRFFTNSMMSDHGILIKKTDTGIVRVSGPERTALDLLAYEKQVGGINRVVTIMAELIESIDPESLVDLAKQFRIVYVQRLGYILEHVLNETVIADRLFDVIIGRSLYRTPLKPVIPVSDWTVRNRWNIIDNIHPEVDL
ncbi:MAG: type IV toxin-antitoxin system AbiEi family antitoxin [bacterium]